MEGPQFSTRAESNLYRSWGCSVIGMTNMPEAKLAREAEICYATVAMVTDYDCWHHEHTDVDVAAIIKVLSENVDKAHRLIERLARDFPREHPPCPVGSDRALDVAIITPPHARDPALRSQARCGGGAGAGLGVRPNDFCRARESHMQTIDSQVHVYDRNHPDRPWHGKLTGPPAVTGDQMVAEMDAADVDGAILVSAYAMYRYDPSYALEVRNRHPTICRRHSGGSGRSRRRRRYWELEGDAGRRRGAHAAGTQRPRNRSG